MAYQLTILTVCCSIPFVMVALLLATGKLKGSAVEPDVGIIPAFCVVPIIGEWLNCGWTVCGVVCLKLREEKIQETFKLKSNLPVFCVK